MPAAPTDVIDAPTTLAPPAPQLRSIIIHLVVSLMTAVVIPSLLFYVCLVSMGAAVAVLAGLVWCYGAIAWRMATKRRASGLLALTVVIMTVRTGIALASGDTFFYFLQPVVMDAIVAAAFFGSLATARPVVGRLAADFYPMDNEIATRPRVQRLFWHLTLLWAFICLVRAGITLWLLESQSLVSFVLIKNLSLFATTIVSVTATVMAAVCVARKEGLLTPG
jgi:hypothetical protein